MSYQTNQEGIRTAIEAARAAWSSYTLIVEYDNAAVVQATDDNPYLKVDIVYLGGDQLDLGPSPMVRDSGFIMLAATSKTGAGTALSVKLLDHVRTFLELKDTGLGPVRTGAAKMQKAQDTVGEHHELMWVPFWADR